ncbi:hypothetical protein OQY15_22080 [Pedobacter sp. MC2016-15]|uniref:hypothetical protein n=1 Tax=Pedobacter sp. MC2016-15 TaxID=2994473 RepID=UPI002247A9BA|nr:hypothetical protein [Pedobacter sp. MC2016-15]MCX2481804.1 hypothetical protein [Pedobacter sp. MC2016-15]
MSENKKNIVFLAEYPNSTTIKEGMSQRMVAIDEQFAKEARVYLFVSHRFFAKKEVYYAKDDVLQYKCNLFIHFLFIMRLLMKSKLLYFHSIQNALPILPCLFFLKSSKKIVLDIHGVVPEEHKFAGQDFKAKLYSITERYIFKNLYLGISVTNAMTRHFRLKYPSLKLNLITYPIIPSNILTNQYCPDEVESSEFIEVIYSGNLQSWQNISLMIEVISNNLSSKIRYTILTGNPQGMIEMLNLHNLSEKDNIIVHSVSPSELGYYYKRSHYGFILRDDITVNRVACPTKLIEYMCYGIIPVVKSDSIGDFKEMGYEYLQVNNFQRDNIRADKSQTNYEVVRKLVNKSSDINIQKFLLNNI